MKTAAEPTAYVQSESGDFDSTQSIGSFGEKADECSCGAAGRERSSGVSDSARIFKPLRSAVCVRLSHFRHIIVAPAAATKNFPD
jgi:hypothetical protein